MGESVGVIRHGKQKKKKLSRLALFFLNNSDTGKLLGLHCPFLQCYLVVAGSVCVHALSLDKSGLMFEEMGFLVCRKERHGERPTQI